MPAVKRATTTSSIHTGKLRNGTFSVDDDDMKRLEVLAKAKGDTVSGLLRQAVKTYLSTEVTDLRAFDDKLKAIQAAEKSLSDLYASIPVKH